MRRPIVPLASALAGLIAVLPAAAIAQPAVPAQAPPPANQPAAPPKAMTIVDLIDVPRLSDPQLSPDGTQVLFVRSDADWRANKRITHIWRAIVATGETTQMTAGADGESTPRWSPDGRAVAFLTKRSGDDVAQIYLLPASGGEATRITTHAAAPTTLSWTPTGDAILFLAPEAKTAAEKTRERVKDDVFVYEQDFKQTHLWRVEVPPTSFGSGEPASTGHIARLTSGDFAVTTFTIAHDGRILHQRAPSPLLGTQDRSELWIMAADGKGARALTSNTVTEISPAISPDGTSVLFTAGADARLEAYHSGRIFVVPVKGGRPRLVTPADFPYEVERAEWAKDGKAILFVANLGVRSEIFTMPAAGGAAKPLTTGDHAVIGWNYFDGPDASVFGFDETANAGDLYVLRGASPPQRVTYIFDSLAREFRLPNVEVVSWAGADGVPVEGLLYYPLDYVAGTRVPLVVQTHGGPAASDRFGFGGWASYTAILAARGYAVLKPNYRGSTGYGDAFLRDMVGHYFQNAHLDVLAGVDAMIAKGVADPDRLVKMGWSAGGHLTNKLITFTDRFKAASSGAGGSNWVSLYAQSDVRFYRTPWFGGTPWQAGAPIDLYWDQSPIRHVSNVKTPTIFLVGDKDPRVPLPQSIEMYQALKSLGVPTKLYVAPREPHAWAELRHQLFKVNAELDWFEQWVTKRPYTWETAPDRDDARTH